jgi:hypothetical protein
MLDLSMNQICGVDKLGQGHWSKDGLEALLRCFGAHPHLRSCSLYLNYLGPRALPLLRRHLPRAAPQFAALNLQFTDLFAPPPPDKTAAAAVTARGGISPGKLLNPAEAEAELRRAAADGRVNVEL